MAEARKVSGADPARPHTPSRRLNPVVASAVSVVFTADAAGLAAPADQGEFDVCMTTPLWYGAAAHHGQWRFERPLNNHLRHPDEWLKINEAVEDDNRVLVGLSGIGPLLVTAIPLGVYNFTEGMSNVESAAAAGDRSVSELAGALPISRPAVSRHLRLLKQAGLVADRAEGTRRLYRLDDEGIAAVREYLEHVWGEAAARFRLAAENTSERRGRDAP